MPLHVLGGFVTDRAGCGPWPCGIRRTVCRSCRKTHASNAFGTVSVRAKLIVSSMSQHSSEPDGHTTVHEDALEAQHSTLPGTTESHAIAGSLSEHDQTAGLQSSTIADGTDDQLPAPGDGDQPWQTAAMDRFDDRDGHPLAGTGDERSAQIAHAEADTLVLQDARASMQPANGACLIAEQTGDSMRLHAHTDADAHTSDDAQAPNAINSHVISGSPPDTPMAAAPPAMPERISNVEDNTEEQQPVHTDPHAPTAQHSAASKPLPSSQPGATQQPVARPATVHLQGRFVTRPKTAGRAPKNARQEKVRVLTAAEMQASVDRLFAGTQYATSDQDMCALPAALLVWQ